MQLLYVVRNFARSLVVVTFAVASPGTPALAAASPAPSPSFTPVPSSAPTACGSAAPGLGDGFDAGFSYEISSNAVEGFIALLGSASREAQTDVIKRASAAARSPEHVDLRAALGKLCPNASEIVGFSRSVAIISHLWSTPELPNDRSANELTDVLQTAISALAHPEAFSTEERAAATSPFQALESAAPTPSAPPTGPCAERYTDASVVYVPPLEYPYVARVSHSTGIVLVKVALSESGGVRGVTLYKKDTTGDDAGGDALVDATIISAAATTFRPHRVNCVPTSGFYLFKAVFDPN